MRRLVHTLFIVVIGTGLLLGAGAGALLLFGDKLLAAGKPRVEQAAGDALDADVRVQKIGVGFFPLALTLEGLSLKTKSGCGAWSVRNVRLDLVRMALLERRLAVRAVRIAGVRAALAQTQAGWAIAEENGAVCEDGSLKSGEPAQEGGKSGGIEFLDNLEEFLLQDAALVLVRPGGTRRIQAALIKTDVDLHGGAWRFSGAQIQGAVDEVPLSVNLGAVKLDLHRKEAVLENSVLAVNQQKISFEGIIEGAPESAQLEIRADGAALPAWAASLNSLSGLPLAPADMQGTVDVRTKFTLHPDGAVTAVGEGALRRCKLGTPAITLDEGVLNRFSVSRAPDGAIRASGDLVLRGAAAGGTLGKFEELTLKDLSFTQQQDGQQTAGGALVVRTLQGGGASIEELSYAPFSLTRRPGGEIAASGDARLRKGGVGGNAALEDLSLSGMSLLWKDGAVQNVKSAVALSGLAIQDGSDGYQTGGAKGLLTFTRNDGMTLSGDLDVQKFGFRDNETVIDNTDAALRRISVMVSRKGDVNVGVDVDGRSFHLTNPSIEIVEASRVVAPLRIAVPAGGGYSVSGPVSVKGAALVLAGRRITQVGGDVPIVVSGPRKEFGAKNVAGVSFDQNLKLSGNFVMEREAYTLEKTTLAFAQGVVTASGRMGRGGDRPAALQAEAENVVIADAWRGVTQKREAPPMEGKILSFRGDFSGLRSRFLETLSGGGNVRIEGAKLGYYDVLSSIKAAVSKIPVAGTVLVPKDAQEERGRETLEFNYKLANQQIVISELNASRSNFTIDGGVTIGFDGKLDGKISAVFLEKSFRSLGLGFDAVAKALGRLGRVSVPLLVGGTISDPSLKPDPVAIVAQGSGAGLAHSMVKGVVSAGNSVVNSVTGK